MQDAFIILAAGRGTRLRASAPNKVLQPLCGVPLLSYILRTIGKYKPARCVMVVGSAAETVCAYARQHYPDIEFAYQPSPQGTGDAVKAAKTALADFSGRVTVLLGDVPFLRRKTLSKLTKLGGEKGIGLVGLETDKPTGYGRLMCDPTRQWVEKIVEEKDCSAEERKITLCNGGILSAASDILFPLLEEISPHNAAGEYYLSDIIGLARAKAIQCGVIFRPEKELLGVNSRHDLVRAQKILQTRLRKKALKKGVFFTAPETVFLSPCTKFSPDCVVEPYVVFAQGVKVGKGAHIRAFSHLEGCDIGQGATIGPYARIRADTVIGENARVGNFVEVKNSQLGAEAKASHLSYIGDSDVGAGANIGAGVITCNYDGVMKHKTEIGAGTFIGSNSALVAPLKIGKDALIGAGSVIVKDVELESVALSRPPQVEHKGIVGRYFMRLKQKYKPAGKKKKVA